MDTPTSPQLNPTVQAPTAIPTSPVVQEAQATMTVPNQGSSGRSKILIGLLVLVLLVVMGVLGYFLYMRSSAEVPVPTSMEVTPAPTNIITSPAPKSDAEAVDQLDTSFPSTDAARIQNDLKGL